METVQDLNAFFERAETDYRIDKGHISLYMALRWVWKIQGRPEEFRIFSREIMPISKISSTTTYVRIMGELEEWGYIRYERSLSKYKGSLIKFE